MGKVAGASLGFWAACRSPRTAHAPASALPCRCSQLHQAAPSLLSAPPSCCASCAGMDVKKKKEKKNNNKKTGEIVLPAKELFIFLCTQMAGKILAELSKKERAMQCIFPL